MRLLPILAATGALANYAPPRIPNAPIASLSLPTHLTARASCPVGYDTCDSFCISQHSSCCSSGTGASCPDGWQCTVTGGCCQLGKMCDNIAPEGCIAETGDGKGSVECGGRCVPSSAVCCDDGTYCYAGQSCNGDGGCDGTAIGLGAGPEPVLSNDEDDNEDSNNGGKDESGDDGEGDGEGDGAVGVRANLALVGLVGAMLVFF